MKTKNADWREVHLLSVAQIRARLVDPKKSGLMNMVLIAPDHIQSGSGRIKERVTALRQGAISGKFLVKKGSVIYSKIRPYLEKAAIADEDVLCSADMYPLECTPDVSPVYLLNVLLSKRFTDFAVSCSNRTGIPKINREELSEFSFLLPPLSEQLAIASLASTWDTAIEKTEQLIAAKKRRNDAFSNQLIFGKYRFEKRNTKPTKKLHWFSVPSDWQIVEIGHIAKEVSAANGITEGLPVLSCTKQDGLVDSLTYFDKQVFSHDTSKYKIVRHGQFAYATNHIEEGSIGYQDFVPAGLVSPIYTVFQADNSKIDDGYLYKLLKTEQLRQIFAANTNASVDRRGSLRWKEFARIHIPLPPLDEQRQISAVLDVAKREISLLQAEVEALKTQKRGLMQKLLTGEWRVGQPPDDPSPVIPAGKPESRPQGGESASEHDA